MCWYLWSPFQRPVFSEKKQKKGPTGPTDSKYIVLSRHYQLNVYHIIDVDVPSSSHSDRIP